MLGFFAKSNSDFSFHKKLLRIINKCLTFDVQLNDLALTTTDSIECLTGVSSRSCPVNALEDKTAVGQNDTISRVVVELFVLQRNRIDIFSNFSCMLLNPNNFFQFELHISNLHDMRNLKEQVKKAFCYQKLF